MMLIANESLVLGTLCDLNCKGSPKPQHAPWTQLIHKTSNREKAWWVKEYTLLLASWLFLISDLSVVKTPAWHVTVVIQDEITKDFCCTPANHTQVQSKLLRIWISYTCGKDWPPFEPEAKDSDPRTYDHLQRMKNLSCKVTTDSCNEAWLMPLADSFGRIDDSSCLATNALERWILPQPCSPSWKWLRQTKWSKVSKFKSLKNHRTSSHPLFSSEKRKALLQWLRWWQANCTLENLEWLHGRLQGKVVTRPMCAALPLQVGLLFLSPCHFRTSCTWTHGDTYT